MAAKDPTKPIDLAVCYLDDTILLNATEAWTYTIIPDHEFAMSPEEDVDGLILSHETSLAALGDAELHLHIAYRDLNLEGWADALDRQARNPAPAWRNFHARMINHVAYAAAPERVVYLGIRLGDRYDWKPKFKRGSTPKEAFKALLDSGQRAVAGPDFQISDAEITKWTESARRIRSQLSRGSLRARGATFSDMTWLITHLQHLAMPEPSDPVVSTVPWGSGDLASLACGSIENKTDPTRLSVTLRQRNRRLLDDLVWYENAKRDSESKGRPAPAPPEAFYSSHVAVLSMSTVPKKLSYPWLQHASVLPFPVELSARLTLVPPNQAEKDAEKAARTAQEIVAHARETGVEATGKDRARALATVQLHEELATGNGRHQIRGTYRLVVAAETRDVLGARCEEVIRHYNETSNLKIAVQWPPGDQWALYRELLPGEPGRVKLYEQRQDLLTFAIGLPFAGDALGDGEGPYIGRMLLNDSPVFYDLATAPIRNRGPAVALIGSLGGGKTNALLTLLDMYRLRGFPTIALDPKGDIKAALLMKGRGNARFFDLSSEGMPGSLDPFTLIPLEVDHNDPERDTEAKAEQLRREETTGLVVDTIHQILGGSVDRSQNTAISMAVSAEMKRPDPSMRHLMEVLQRGGIDPVAAEITNVGKDELRTAAVSVHAQLELAANTTLGRLMFSRNDGPTERLLEADTRCTIVSLSGLSLPQDGEPPRGLSECFSVALFMLAAYQARRALQDLDYVGPRGMFMDETHQITPIQSGKSLIVSTARLGRSRDFALVLATQNAGDLAGAQLRNCTLVKFAFRSTDSDERRQIAEYFGRPAVEGDTVVLDSIPDQTAPGGTCLMQDLDGRIGLMRWDRWATEWELFDTTPTREQISAAGTRIKTDSRGRVVDGAPPAPVPVAVGAATDSKDDWWAGT